MPLFIKCDSSRLMITGQEKWWWWSHVPQGNGQDETGSSNTHELEPRIIDIF